MTIQVRPLESTVVILDGPPPSNPLADLLTWLFGLAFGD